MALMYFQAEIITDKGSLFRLAQGGNSEKAKEAVEEYCNDNGIEHLNVEIHETIKVKTSTNSTPWKEHYHIYCKYLSEGQDEAIKDLEWIKLQELRWPNVDISKTIEYMIQSFWGTKEGWHHCKKKRGVVNLNWKSTFANNIGKNRIYKDRNNGQSKSKPLTTTRKKFDIED